MLIQVIEQYDNWFEFFVKLYFCIRVFQSGVLLENFGAGLDPESVKNFQSEFEVEKLATPQCFTSKTFQAKATFRL